MKKIWLTIAGSLFIALASVNAQDRTSSDTTGTGSTQSTEYQYQWRDEDRETLTRDDLPTGLVETLEGGQYEGWENATIYRNKTSNDYMLVIQDSGTTRTFYFDKEGKERPMTPGAPQGQYDSSQSQGMQSDSSSVNYSGQGSSTQTDTTSSTSGTTSSSSASDNEGDDTEGAVSNTTVQDRPTSDLMSGSTTSAGTAGQDSRYSTGKDDDDDEATKDNDDNDATVTTSGQSTSNPTGNSTYNTTDQSSSATVTGSTTQTGSTTSDQSGLQTTTGDDMSSNAWNKEDRVVITTNELPSSLLISLGDPKYRGWENSTVYRNRKNNQYMIEIRDGSDTRTYYFDKDGKAVVNTSGNSIDE
jgi:hypothetical protein